MHTNTIRRFAIIGARARLAELDTERRALQAFLTQAEPASPRTDDPTADAPQVRKRKPRTLAQRANMRRAAKAYWRKRKAAEA